MIPPPPSSTLFPYTTLFRSQRRLRPRPADPHRPAGAPLRLAERQEPRQVRADGAVPGAEGFRARPHEPVHPRSEEHTSELQSLRHLVCRLLLEKKKQYVNIV